LAEKTASIFRQAFSSAFAPCDQLSGCVKNKHTAAVRPGHSMLARSVETAVSDNTAILA
jgi:hypothetical protein